MMAHQLTQASISQVWSLVYAIWEERNNVLHMHLVDCYWVGVYFTTPGSTMQATLPAIV